MALQPLNFTKAVSTSAGRLSAITATDCFAESSLVSPPASSAIEPEASSTKTTSGASQDLRSWIACSQACFGVAGGGVAAATSFGGSGLGGTSAFFSGFGVTGFGASTFFSGFGGGGGVSTFFSGCGGGGVGSGGGTAAQASFLSSNS